MDIAAVSPAFASWVWLNPADKLTFMKARDIGEYPVLRDLVTYTPMIAVGIVISKLVLEYLVFRPFCRTFLRLKAETLPFSNAKLETIYKRNKPRLPDINEIKSLSKELKKTVEELNKWFRTRQLIDRDAIKVRVAADSLWRLFMYSVCFVVNIRIVRDKAWFKDISLCWDSLPFQTLDPGVREFYAGLVIPFYTVLLLFQVIDKRRAKDHWEMATHHFLVVVLMSIVFLGNYCRIGMIGLLYHDVTDLFIESSKIANLFRFKGLADLCFAGFTFSWGYARLYKFPVTVYGSILSHGVKVIGKPAYNFMVIVLGFLLILNLYWYQKIAKLAYRIFWAGASKERRERDFTDLSTDDDIDSDSSYLSDAEGIKRHED